jgi:signal transduction histidine kinase
MLEPTFPILILNVDDYDAGRYLRTRLLREAGYDVLEAGNGAEALHLAETRAPALVLLDVHLPDISGLEVCRRIKSNENLSDVIVLHLSASAVSGPQRALGLDSGADSYLTEPIEADVLLATVRSLLRLRKAESDLRKANTALLETNRELGRLNAALRASNEDLQRFSYLASHDLQEPLRTIICFSELLAERHENQLGDEAKKFLGYLRQAAGRMGMLIRDLLAYAEANQETEFQMESCSLDEVFGWATANLKQSIDETEVSILQEPLPRVIANPIQFTQLFQNLIGNAIKYRQPSRPLEIRITAERQPEEHWLLSVADNGIGIPAEFQKDIFAPFKRLHGHEVPGTGIGLATCRRIIERHGGQIWVESVGAGQGSTFYVTLPVRLTA